MTELYTERTAPVPTMEEIRDVICDFYGISRIELETRNRRALPCRARQVFCWLAHKYCKDVTLNMIARRVGHIDHTTVLHSIRVIGSHAANRPLEGDDLDVLRERIAEKVLGRKQARHVA